MVTMRRPVTLASERMHDRTASPSTCTVHAPHAPMPQPNLVPVSPSPSRNAQSSGMAGSAMSSDKVR